MDTEFTGLHKSTTLISIGLISSCGKTFYAELTDYDKSQINEWLQYNVIEKLTLDKDSIGSWGDNNNLKVRGDKKSVKYYLESWIKQFEDVEIWSDVLAYDWVLFCDIFGSAFDLPKNVSYIPFDISTLFEERGIDPDINRESFVAKELEFIDENKHNALYDALLINLCYNKLNYIENDKKTI